MTVEEIPLEGGNINVVVRVGDTVRRPVGPHSDAVHALLQHLERVGFDGAPRFLGIDDQGREILSFVPGEALWPVHTEPLQYVETLTGIGRVIRQFHDAATSFVPPADTVWSPQAADPAGGSMIVHGDLGPWNIVCDDAGTFSIIDWDTVTCGRVEWDLALAIHVTCWLGGDTPPWRSEELSDEEVAERIRSLADGYGLDDATLRATLGLIPARGRGIVELIQRKAAAGEPAWVQMFEDGHHNGWAASAAHVESRLSTWCAALFGPDPQV